MRIAMRAQGLPSLAKADWAWDIVWTSTLLAVMLALFACGNLNSDRTPHGRSIPVMKHVGPQREQGVSSALARL